MQTNKQAFTLIELLVVVLIIGILAAVALPQYQKAVTKSLAVEALTNLNVIEKAQHAYRLSNGTYTRNLAELDILINNSSKVSYECPSTAYCVASVLGKGIRFEWVFASDFWGSGQHRCVANKNDSVAYQTCQGLGGTYMAYQPSTYADYFLL
ncbi:MAG: type II secretion system protein [Elusimicrobiaceae bacterium]|nr:type II secretion system protein [Elusimicrobiaceae bacterium]